MQMRNDAIVCNIGHFDCEIDVKGCARFFGVLTLSKISQKLAYDFYVIYLK